MPRLWMDVAPPDSEVSKARISADISSLTTVSRSSLAYRGNLIDGHE